MGHDWFLFSRIEGHPPRKENLRDEILLGNLSFSYVLRTVEDSLETL